MLDVQCYFLNQCDSSLNVNKSNQRQARVKSTNLILRVIGFSLGFFLGFCANFKWGS